MELSSIALLVGVIGFFLRIVWPHLQSQGFVPSPTDTELPEQPKVEPAPRPLPVQPFKQTTLAERLADLDAEAEPFEYRAAIIAATPRSKRKEVRECISGEFDEQEAE